MLLIVVARDRWLVTTLSNIEHKVDRLSRLVNALVRDSIPATCLPDGIKLPLTTDEELHDLESRLLSDGALINKLVRFVVFHPDIYLPRNV